ncbi:TPA: helix-turn-helix domain-containing protein [Acinetobacter baumannii]|nr:AraC family transcriptional regulator [Acinetobacter baumannii]HEE5437360.1 helix-turn-helix domain-containing protein [Acinetobacter baumannii]
MLNFFQTKSLAGCMSLLLEKFCMKNNLKSPVKNEYKPGERIIFELWLKKINFIYNQLPREGLGLDIAKEVDAGSVGVFAYIAYSSKNIREINYHFSKYNKLWYDYTDKEFGYENGNFFISWEPPSYTFIDSYSLETDIAEELQVAIIHNMIFQHLPGISRAFYSLDLAIKKPKNVKKYEEYFGCSVRFETKKTKIVILESILDIPLPTYDPTLLKILLVYADTIIANFLDTSSFIELVNKNIIRALKNHKAQLDIVAGYIGLSPRVLQKKLKARDVTFLELLDTVRYQKAMQYLLEGELSINEIAYLLGYREQASFNRAFKLWTGMSPNQWRKSRETIA